MAEREIPLFLLVRAALALGTALLCEPTESAEYYVAPNGNDVNPGTFTLPFASAARGQQAATAGDTVWLRGGVYAFSGTTQSVGVLFNKSGNANNRIKYFAYQNETP